VDFVNDSTRFVKRVAGKKEEKAEKELRVVLALQILAAFARSVY
jgi:hypothetical protein